ncbi:MAG: glycosyl hydrolase [Ignavibacteria bacterium]
MERRSAPGFGGKNFWTADEFKTLWKFTVNYLKKKNITNVLYSYSPDKNFYNEEKYIEKYPDDDYVDIHGIDNYYNFTPDDDGLKLISNKLKIISELAEKKNKIAAYTETGLESIPDST